MPGQPHNGPAGKTNKELLQTVYTTLLGIPGTEETGVVGDLKDIKSHLADLNGAVRTNTAWRKAHTWVIGLTVTGLIAISAFIATHL